MNLSPKIMAFWVIIFISVYFIEQFQLVQSFGLDEKSIFVGFITGALLMKLAPSNARK